MIRPNDLFCRPTASNTRGHAHKLAHVRCRLLCRQRFFSVRVVQMWNDLPAQVAECKSLDGFKSGLRSSLSGVLFSYEG